MLDHFWTSAGGGRVVIAVDGRELWRGSLADATNPKREPGENLFPHPLAFAAGGMYHLLVPIGFRTSLDIRVDRETFPHFLSLRILPPDSPVMVPDPAPGSRYASLLRKAAESWRKGGQGLGAEGLPDAVEHTTAFVLPARGREVVLKCSGSGEIVRLEFHLNPALVGSLRNVVAEFFYDGAAAPSLRLPITDLVGVSHPWPIHRWHPFNGDLAGGIRYPWRVDRPRFNYPQATFVLNLPIPFATGFRIEFNNRSRDVRFSGRIRAWIRPLIEEGGRPAGRLRGLRKDNPLAGGEAPQPLIRLQGRGQVVGLGLFATGGRAYPPAVRKSTVAVNIDDGTPTRGPGLLPLWFQGIYGGPVTGMPIWNHMGYYDQYAAVMRHFLTDPVPFQRSAELLFTSGPDPRGAPADATAVALWYEFGDASFTPPELPVRAGPLPYSDLDFHVGRDSGRRLFWVAEAEELAPMATARGGEVRIVEDREHNVHPSRGKFLQVVADRPGDWVDCVVPLPASRYLSVGTVTIWGPNLGEFELDVLPREAARTGVDFEQGDAFYLGRVLGAVPMRARVFAGHSLNRRRDSSAEFSTPFLNPAPDSQGLVRFICRSKPRGSNAYRLQLDQILLATPEPPKEEWREFEAGPLPEKSDGTGVRARIPKYGRTAWSGWGALLLSGKTGGRTRIRGLVPAVTAKPKEIVIRGCLGPRQGRWQAGIGGSGAPVALTPGKDEKEVVEWALPLGDANLPGTFTLEIDCTSAPDEPARKPEERAARLALDAWTLRGRPSPGRRHGTSPR